MIFFGKLLERLREGVKLAVLGGVDDARVALEGQVDRERKEKVIQPGVALLIEGPKVKKGR